MKNLIKKISLIGRNRIEGSEFEFINQTCNPIWLRFSYVMEDIWIKTNNVVTNRGNIEFKVQDSLIVSDRYNDITYSHEDDLKRAMHIVKDKLHRISVTECFAEEIYAYYTFPKKYYEMYLRSFNARLKRYIKLKEREESFINNLKSKF